MTGWSTRGARLGVVVALVATTLVGMAVPSHAALTLTVTTTDDVVDAGDGELSLREAATHVVVAGGVGHQIVLPAGTYALDDGVVPLFTFTSGYVGVTVSGAGMDATVIDGQGLSRVFLVHDADVTFEHLTVTGGRTPDDAAQGGGIFFAGGDTELRLDHVRLTGNIAQTVTEIEGQGGGIGTDPYPSELPGSVEIVDSLIDHNQVLVGSKFGGAAGGGAFVQAAAVRVQRTRFLDNTATGLHRTYHAAWLGPVELLDTVTVAGNGEKDSSGAPALGLLTGGDMLVRDVTVDSEGGGINVVSTGGTATVEHTTIRAGGTALARDSAPEQEVIVRNSVIDGAGQACEHATGVPFVSGGGNVVADATCGLAASTDQVVADPGLGALDTSTTPVPVLPLLPGSPALDAGVAGGDGADARGAPRPSGAAADAGAYEHQAPVAADDVAATVQRTPVQVDVLANDTAGQAPLDPDSITFPSLPRSATASVVDGGIVEYVPDDAGQQTFVYEVCQQDFTSVCDTAEVVVEVAAAPGPDLDRGVSRIEGGSRYETAAAVSRASFDPGLDVVFLATGANFPDALAGGPLAAELGAPILLTSPTGLPSATADELARLRPGTVVALGGEGVVTAQTLAEAAAAAGGAATDRHAGGDRFATAAEIARELPPADTVYLATGGNFPDALAGGPVTDGAPILLAAASGLPDATAAVLAELAPDRVVALGGTAVVSDEVLAAAAAAAGTGATTDRLAGGTRYETAVAIARLADSTDTVFVATGENFPDALAAAPVAAMLGAGILLTPPESLAAATADRLEQTGPRRIVLLGGPAAVTVEVEAALTALVGGG